MKHYRKDILLIPNALDLSQYSFRPRRQPHPHLIWLRAFHKIYNPEMAVRIVALARQAAPAIRLTMIGPDKGDGQLQRTKQLADRLGVLDRIEFIPGVAKSEVPRWLQSGDIFLNTSTVDNTPVSVLEAMACGLCVVSTDVGGLRYLLTHEHDALIAPSADENGMTSAVFRILNDAALSTRLSENARRKAAQLDWSAILPLWEELFRRTAQRNVR
jgi:glycosyltransferase involved in cell wall biosynthesis